MNSLPSSPFKDGAIHNSELSPVLYEHSLHPDELIRQNIEFGLGDVDPVGKTLEGLRKSRELFSDLEKNYGIRHAGFRPVVGELPSGEVAAYIVTDRIEGFAYQPKPDQVNSDNLELQVINPEHIPAGIALLQSLSDYWIDKVTNQEAILTDIFSIDQFIYEKETDEFVLVDMDPLFAEASQMKDQIGSQWVIKYTRDKLQTLAKTLLDSHELEVWQKEMAVATETE